MFKPGWIALLVVLLFVVPVTAQDACANAQPARLTVGQQGIVTVDSGFFLNVRTTPGVDTPVVVQLASGESFAVLDGPECVDGHQWWQVRQFALSGWIAESAGRDYLVEPVNQDAPAAPTPGPVLLTTLPDTLATDFVAWDWAQFLESTGSFYAPPDPLAIRLPETFQGTWPAAPFDLDSVRFADEVDLTLAQRDLLAQNGFVVVPGGLDQFEDVYRFDNTWDPNTGHSYWVTTDAVLHSLYVAFDNLLQFLETETLHTQLLDVVAASYDVALEQWLTTSNSVTQAAAYDALVYYAVALGLLDSATYDAKITPDVRVDADPLIAAAVAGEGRLAVPFLPRYDEDFSQYKPRGHYTTSPEQTRYFRTMMWLGRITFLARDDESLQASLLALWAMQHSGQYATWASISDLLTFLVGPTDNLGPRDYLPLAESIYGEDWGPAAITDADKLAEFKAAVQALPGPRINNEVRPIGTEVDELDETTRGFRLFGQRFTLDGYIMQRLIYPYVGDVGNERTLPSGLDVASALGSDVAYELLDAQGDTAYTDYVPNMIGLRSEVSQMNAPDWLQTAYSGWLWAVQPLWARAAEQYPAFMSTTPWLQRDLQAGLASWAELKHATILYAAQPMGGLGGGGERELNTHSWVEPQPLVFARIAVVAAALEQGMRERGLGDYAPSPEPPGGIYFARMAFQNLAELSAMLAEMARKELWGEPLTDDEQLFLKYDYGSKLWVTRYLAEQPLAEPPEMAAIVTDVASNPDAGTVLQVGTGQVDLIYVITDSPGGLQLTRGSVYSYYEFVNPIDNRLDDDTWRAMVRAGELPPRPEWIAGFFAP